MWQQTLETRNFKIDGQEKILEIHLRTEKDNGMKLIKMEDTAEGHNGIILETRKKKSADVFLIEEDREILFIEDKEGDLCSFNAVRKVHEVNRHKGKEQLLNAYRKAGWMSPELSNIIDRVVNDCKICQKFYKFVARPRVTL